jgi:hypothetical protein
MRTHGRTDTTNLIGASHNYANVAKNDINARFEVLTAVLIKSQVFWDMTPCRFVNRHRNFGVNCYLRKYNTSCANKNFIYHTISNMFRQICHQQAVYKNNNENTHSYISFRSQSFTYMCYEKIYVTYMALGIKSVKLHIFAFFKNPKYV